jgi:hypothetical protein
MRTGECERASEQAAMYAANPEQGAGALSRALDHMRGCPHCQGRLQQLLAAMRAGAEEALSCEACQEALPGYLEATGAGQPEDAAWALVSRHLRSCPVCTEVADELRALANLAGAGDAAQNTLPQPDLSFLQPRGVAAPGVIRQLDQFGRLVLAFSADVLHALLAQGPRPALQGATKAGIRRLWEVTLPDDAPDLEVVVAAETPHDDPSRARLTVQVVIPSRGGWPNLEGTLVTLAASGSPPRTEVTDAFGIAVFDAVDVRARAGLEITVQPPAP